MDKDQIISLLKQINYPGYNRDIISFGIISDLQVSDNSINLKLNIKADTDIANNITESINSLLKKEYSNIKVNIEIISTDNKTNVTGEIKALSKVKNIIAIASGKGGVGKSTTTVNLASNLSKNLKVGILDLDIYGPSLQMALGCYEKPVMNTNNMLQPIEKYGMKLMSFGFLNDESAPTIWRGPMVSRMTEQFFSQVDWGELDILFLDLPPGTGDIQLTLVQKLAITGAIIVTTPQELALLDVKKGADMFEKVNTPVIGVIENMTHFLCPNCNVSSKIFPGTGGDNESSRLNVPLLGKIYLSPELAISADEGMPYVLKYKSSPITLEYEKIAQQLKHLSTPNP